MSDKLVPVEGRPDLARNRETGAIVTINSSRAHAARERKRLRQQKNQEKGQLIQQVRHLESEISEIKALLQQLVTKG